MGALHEGHLSLVKQSLNACNHTAVSVFVNPTQFAPDEDFDSYPRDLNKDQSALESLGVDVLFLPDDKIIYPDNFSTYVEENMLAKGLESLSRPPFFKGVLTVVLKLFNIVNPDFACFGKKDAQQLLLIEKLVRLGGFSVKIVRGDTVREESGLAMSSRNQYLTIDEQKEIVRIIVSKEQSNRVFESMYLAGNLDTPGKGIMWMVKLDRVATHIPKDVLKRAGGAG